MWFALTLISCEIIIKVIYFQQHIRNVWIGKNTREYFYLDIVAGCM